MADMTTVAASGVVAVGAAAALQMPQEGVILCSAIGALAAAWLDVPPEAVTPAWIRSALARGVGFVSVGIMAPYILPSLLQIEGIGKAPAWAISLLASSMAPYLLTLIRARGDR